MFKRKNKLVRRRKTEEGILAGERRGCVKAQKAYVLLYQDPASLLAADRFVTCVSYPQG